MAKYIKREAAIESIKQHLLHMMQTVPLKKYEREFYTMAHQHCADVINIVPAADVVEVVRCGECEWWTKLESSCQGRCERYGIYPTAAWYCAAGTKMDKEDENNEV